MKKIIAEEKDPAKVSVSEVMSDHVHNIDCESSIFEARGMMSELKVKHLIVVEKGKPIGLLSPSSLLGS